MGAGRPHVQEIFIYHNSSVQEIGSEIGQVSSIPIECGLHTLSLTNGRKRHRLKDEVLNNLCALSMDARKVWVKAGQPSSQWAREPED